MSLVVNNEILLYGDVGDLWGDGSGFTVRAVAEALAQLPDGKVRVRINSGGGNAFDGVAIYSLLAARGCDVMIDGLAASAASLIAMAGESIEIAPGAMVMIHDASGLTWGNAEDHQKQANTLNSISDNYAKIYAKRSGKGAEEIRAIMKAETWFTAEDAVAQGFASAVAGEGQTPTAFDYSVYRAAPAALPRRDRPAQPAAIVAALPKEETMKVDPNAPANNAPANDTPAVKAWAHDVYVAAGKAGLTLAQTAPIVEKSDSREAAFAAIIDEVHAKAAPNEPDPNGNRIKVDADAGDKFREGVAQALMARGGVAERDGKNEFNGITLMSLVQDIAGREGPLASRDPSRLIQMAVTHSSSDFPAILENVANKSMLKGYEEQDETFQLWTASGSLTDFKPTSRVDLNAFGSLPTVGENAEYTFGTIGERKETIQLATYGRMLSISRQAIINDDVNAFTMIPRKMGRAALRTVGNEVYKILTSNPNMSDNVALFHASHANLATGGGSALSSAALDAARTAMARQKDRTEKGAVLNITPRFLLVPKTLEGLAIQLMEAQYDIKGSASDPNAPSRVRGMATPVADARLDEASTASWYLAASQSYDTVEVAYLNGQRTPTIERQDIWMVDGVNFKIRLDFAAKALAWETLYKGNGS